MVPPLSTSEQATQVGPRLAKHPFLAAVEDAMMRGGVWSKGAGNSVLRWILRALRPPEFLAVTSQKVRLDDTNADPIGDYEPKSGVG